MSKECVYICTVCGGVLDEVERIKDDDAIAFELYPVKEQPTSAMRMLSCSECGLLYIKDKESA